MNHPTEVFLFLEPGADPARDRQLLDPSAGRTLLAWVPDGAAAAKVADEAAAGGARLVELYRGFDLESAADVIDAVDGRAPVGVATTGPDDRWRRDGARSVTLFEDPDATLQPVVHDHLGGGRTTVLVATDEESTVRIALEQAAQGADLVEICGGKPLTTAAAVRRALDDRVAVSSVGFPFESITGAAAYKASFG